jgi:hypothetical protein
VNMIIIACLPRARSRQGRHRRTPPAWDGISPPRRLASRMVPPAPDARFCCAVVACSERVAAVAPFRKDESEGIAGAAAIRPRGLNSLSAKLPVRTDRVRNRSKQACEKWTLTQIPCCCVEIPCSCNKNSLFRLGNFALSPLNHWTKWPTSEPRVGPKLKNSLLISLLAGNLGVATGSIWTASAHHALSR